MRGAVARWQFADRMMAAAHPGILVIRGGAIGDFLLTLPAIALLRASFPGVRLEILGYPHIAALAVAAGLADAVRPLETAALARFFGDPRKTPTLDPGWSAYFAGFGLIVSHLFDPDGFFVENLRRAGARQVVESGAKVDSESGVHAARQLARGLESLGLSLEEPAIVLGFKGSNQAGDFGSHVPAGESEFALHPGSGSRSKNWPADRWLSVVRALLDENPHRRLLLVGGEADGEAMETLVRGLPPGRVHTARDLSLPDLGARLAGCRLFLGHDSGISHLAAVAGCPCLLLFGPTDPDVWAPPHRAVRVLRAPGGDPGALEPEPVLTAAQAGLK